MATDKGDEKQFKDESRDHDTSFKGPIKNRSCTDILCCLIFIIFVVALLFISTWAYIFGDMNKLIHPTNSKGELCGITPTVKNKPKLVFFNLFTCVKMGPAVIATGCPTKQVCVSKCPTKFWSKTIDTGRSNMVCVGDKTGDDVPYKDMDPAKLLNDKLCAEYVFPSMDVSNRCIPDFTQVVKFLGSQNSTGQRTKNDIMENVKKYDKIFSVAEVGSKILGDMKTASTYMILGFVAALLMSLVYLVLLRFFAPFMVWTTIILFVFIFIVGAGLCYFTYYLMQPGNLNLRQNLSWYALSKYQSDQFWLGMGIGITVILVILVLILIFLRSRIRIAIAILNSTSKSLGYMMGLLIWPVILFLMQIALIIGCVLLAMQLYTIKKPEGVGAQLNNLTILNGSDIQQNLKDMLNKIPCNPGQNSTAAKICTFIKYGTKTYVYIFMFYVLFMFFWLTNFITALGQITIAGSFASYYFAFSKPKDIPTFPVISSFWRAIRYHLGSLAFGSLILAIVQFIKAILQYIEQKAKMSQNIIAEFFVKCLRCCFWCVETFLKFLNKNAYIMIAIYGQSFCAAARNAFNLILRNMVRVFVVDGVTNFVLFMGKLVIVGFVGTLSFVFFNGMILKENSPKLNYFYIPVIILIIGTYIISSMFFQIFDMGTDTIFLCFCEDLERNDGSAEKPYFMSKELMSILGKDNEKGNKEEAIELTP